jgi:hypothetical protein
MKMYSDAVVNKEEIEEIELAQEAQAKELRELKITVWVIFLMNFLLTAVCYFALN